MDTPSSFSGRQIPAFDRIFDLIDRDVIGPVNVEERVIGTLEEVFIEVDKDFGCLHDVGMNVTVKLVHQEWYVRSYPSVVFCESLEDDIAYARCKGCY